MCSSQGYGRFFFFNDTATTEIYTLSLHDALPISRTGGAGRRRQIRPQRLHDQPAAGAVERARPPIGGHQDVAGQGDGDPAQGHGSYSILLDTSKLPCPTALPQVPRGRYCSTL